MKIDTALKQSLSLRSAVLMVAGSMIGSGIFIVSTSMAATVGSAGYLLLLWLLSGAITLMAALCYSELAAMYPKAGGQFVFIKEAFGRPTAFAYGFTLFTVIQTGVIAAVAVAFAKFSAVIFPSLSNTITNLYIVELKGTHILAVASIILTTYINSRGIKTGQIVQDSLTIIKLVAIILIIASGFYMAFQSDVLTNNIQNLWQAKRINEDGLIENIKGSTLIIVSGLAIIKALFSSDAWNNVTFIASEIRSPEKNLPRSLIYGTLIVTIVYFLTNFAYLCLLPFYGNPNGSTPMELGIQYAADERIGTAAISVILGKIGIVVMAILIMISTFGCNNGLILAGARAFYAMAHEKLFFEKAGHLNKHNVPSNALWIQGFWASALCLTGSYSSLVNYATFSSLIFYIITILGLIILRKKQPNIPRPYKVMAYPFLPVLYIICALLICVILTIYDSQNTQFSILCMLLGFIFYHLLFKKKYAN